MPAKPRSSESVVQDSRHVCLQGLSFLCVLRLCKALTCNRRFFFKPDASSKPTPTTAAANAGTQSVIQATEYQGHFDNMFSFVGDFFKAMGEDPVNKRFGEVWARLTKNLLFDSKGNLMFKPKLWSDIWK